MVHTVVQVKALLQHVQPEYYDDCGGIVCRRTCDDGRRDTCVPDQVHRPRVWLRHLITVTVSISFQFSLSVGHGCEEKKASFFFGFLSFFYCLSVFHGLGVPMGCSPVFKGLYHVVESAGIARPGRGAVDHAIVLPAPCAHGVMWWLDRPDGGTCRADVRTVLLSPEGSISVVTEAAGTGVSLCVRAPGGLHCAGGPVPLGVCCPGGRGEVRD